MATKAEKARDKIARQAHRSWVGWMEHLFKVTVQNSDGTVTIPRRKVDRWKRLIDTRFEDLSDAEKLSDFVEADKYIDVVDDKESTVSRRG